MASDYIFCRIIRGEIPLYKVYEDENTLAFLDINPASPGHTLSIPKTHVAQVEDMTAEDVVSLFKTLHKIVRSIQEAFNALASTIGINNGRESGREVPHVHINIIPRKHPDRLSIVQNFNRIKKNYSRGICRERSKDKRDNRELITGSDIL